MIEIIRESNKRIRLLDGLSLRRQAPPHATTPTTPRNQNDTIPTTPVQGGRTGELVELPSQHDETGAGKQREPESEKFVEREESDQMEGGKCVGEVQRDKHLEFDKEVGESKDWGVAKRKRIT